MSNILKAIINIANCPIYETKNYYKSRNRANNMGEALELFVKDAFAGSFDAKDDTEAECKHRQVFSYEGNQNNPPDIILKNGDAIEVKKIESAGSSLALNSSYPKAKLFADSNMITSACKNCEKWTVKDLLYCVGVVNDKHITRLAFVYGIDYAASKEIYERISGVIKSGVKQISDVEFAETNELGRVNRVDPLGITYLRIRGMWGIENPFKVFSKHLNLDNSKDFNFIAVINEEKIELLPKEDWAAITNCKELNIAKIQIKVPDNPINVKNAYLISFAR